MNFFDKIARMKGKLRTAEDVVNTTCKALRKGKVLCIDDNTDDSHCSIIIYPKKDTFIEKFKVKGNYKSFELEICTKEKSVPPTKDEHSTSEN